MSNKNIFRIKRQSVKDNFILDFAAKDIGVDSYVKVSLAKNWISTKHRSIIKRIDVSDYEDTLINFLENRSHETTKHPLLIIVGGAGSGKSSSIKYAVKNANICTGCILYDKCDKNYPSRITFDYLEFKSEAIADLPFSQDEEHIEEREEKFWHHAIRVLDNIILDNISDEREVSLYWKWLVTKCRGAYVFALYKLLFPKLRLFEDPIKNHAELFRLRENLYSTLSAKHLAYYKLYLIAFLRQEKNVNCNSIIFDNIDTLDPYLQVELIDFAIEAHRLFNCKSIIPMRPHTFYLNRDASDFIELIEHCTPSLNDVVEKRLKLFQKTGDKDVAVALSKVTRHLLAHSVMKDVFHASAGESIRFGLRNLFNFLLSPLIVTHTHDMPLNEIYLDLNIFFQAFFCSETGTEELYEENFVNILSINRGPRTKYLSTIKLRTLFLIYQNKEIKIKKVVAHLKAFGFEEEDILETLNDFLAKRKALIYSSSLTHYNIKTLKEGNDHIIAITPMGINYYDKLIKQTSYLRECIVSIDSIRERYREESLKRTIDCIKELFELDLEEIKSYINKHGISEYRKLYPNTDTSITFLLWNKMLQNFKAITENMDYFEFDDQFGNVMDLKVKELISKV